MKFALEVLDNGRQVAISCEFLATMDAMEEMLQKKKISCALVDGRCANRSRLNEAERLREKGGAKTVGPIK